MNPDDQNQGGQGDTGGTPPTDQPAGGSEQPVSAETCATCGGASTSGNCTNCGAPNVNCTCPPTQGSGGAGGGMGGPAPTEPTGSGPTAPAM